MELGKRADSGTAAYSTSSLALNPGLDERDSVTDESIAAVSSQSSIAGDDKADYLSSLYS